jgi:hypothetical protein
MLVLYVKIPQEILATLKLSILLLVRLSARLDNMPLTLIYYANTALLHASLVIPQILIARLVEIYQVYLIFTIIISVC